MKFIEYTGKKFLGFISTIGDFFEFLILGTVYILIPPYYLKNLQKHIIEIGFFSLPIVALTAFFSGMVLALQSYIGFARFSAESAIPNVLVIAITREIGPVFAGLMVSGRIASSMAAEIGTMRVSEQIDAMSTLSVNPIKYLVSPRILASILSVPFLVLVSDILGVMGGFVVSVFQLDFNPQIYIINTWNFMTFWDLASGLIKSVVFGYVVAIFGCYNGYKTKNGAKGVGKATTNAVVSSSIFILLLNFVLTQLFFKNN